MRKVLFTIGILVVIIIATTLNVVSAHSYMLRPQGDFSSFNQAHCRQGGPSTAPDDSCPGPCINEMSWQYNEAAERKPFKYSRNQTLTVVWPRNNHRGGFVRFSLVPKHLRMSKLAHEKYAFRFSCYEADMFPCNENHCGTDEWLYRTDIQIPTSFSNGAYVLSWAWYGGLTQTKSFFGDYYSCTYVELVGGPSSSSYVPSFIPGNNTNYQSECRSSVDRLGICTQEPCHGYVEKRMKPFPFSEGQATPIEYVSAQTNSKKVHSKSWDSPRVLGLEMLDCITNDVMTKEFPRVIFVPEDKKDRISFKALIGGDVESVSFYLNNMLIRTESVQPYFAWGDKNGEVRPWPDPIFGERFHMRILAAGQNGVSDEKTFEMELRPVVSADRAAESSRNLV